MLQAADNLYNNCFEEYMDEKKIEQRLVSTQHSVVDSTF